MALKCIISIPSFFKMFIIKEDFMKVFIYWGNNFRQWVQQYVELQLFVNAEPSSLLWNEVKLVVVCDF